jgi:hypothetical protein
VIRDGYKIRIPDPIPQYFWEAFIIYNDCCNIEEGFLTFLWQNAGCYAALFDGAVYGDGRAPDVGVHGDDLCPLQAVVLGSTRLGTAQGKHVTAHISSYSYASCFRLGYLL